MSESGDQDTGNQQSEVDSEDSGEVFFKTSIPKAEVAVGTPEKGDSAGSGVPLNLEQELSAITVTEDSDQSPVKPLSEFEQIMQLIQTMNKQMADNAIEIRRDLSQKISENTECITRQIAQVKEDTALQMEKISSSFELKINNFIGQQEKDTKTFVTNMNRHVNDRMEQTRVEMKCMLDDEVEKRENQAEIIHRTMEHDRIQLTEKLQEHRDEAYEMEKAHNEKMGILGERISRNIKAISIVNKEVEICMKQHDRVIEEVTVIKGKMESNVTPIPVIASHVPNIRINIPTFSGNDNTSMAPHFLNTLEEYFAITNVHKSQWLTYLGQAFQGSAIAWFRQVKPTCTNWDVFKGKFLESYHGAVQRMRYAAQVEESKQRMDEKAEFFIWRMNDVIKLAYPYLKEEEIVMFILRKMKCGFGVLIRDNIRSILDLVYKANEMEEVIRIDGKSSDSSSYNTNESRNTRQGLYNQQSNPRQDNNRGRWQKDGYRSNQNDGFYNRTPQGDNSSNNAQDGHNAPNQRNNKDSQPIQVATVDKGKGRGKKSAKSQDTNAAKTQADGHLNGQRTATAGQVVVPSTSTST